ncbi:MAG: hypothetical protein AAGF81_20405 [Pseudomonadota bacterium]
MTDGNPTFLRAQFARRTKPGAGLPAVVAVTCGGTAGGPSSVSLTAEAKRVEVVADEAAVRACRKLCEVMGPPPYLLPGDGVNRMKNRVGALGGKELLVMNYAVGVVRGVADRC